MSQHSFSIADEAGAAYRADVNNALQALASQSSGATEPATRYQYEVWADTTASLVKRRNAANSAWLVIASLSETYVVSRASNTILAGSDYGKTFVATAGFTQTLTAAATLGDGWQVDYRIEAGVTIVFDPNGAENIDGAATKSVTGPAGGTIRCDGGGFKTVGFHAATAVALATARAINGVSFDGTANITVPAVPSFESAEIAIGAGGTTTTVAHGLGVVPRQSWVVLRNKTAEFGYSIGDEAYIGNGNSFTTYMDATNIGIVSVTGNVPAVVRRDTFGFTTITSANWKYVMRANK